MPLLFDGLPGWPALLASLADGLDDALEDELLLELDGDGKDELLLDGLELETLGEELDELEDELGLDGEGMEGALLDDEELDGEGMEGMLDDGLCWDD